MRPVALLALAALLLSLPPAAAQAGLPGLPVSTVLDVDTADSTYFAGVCESFFGMCFVVDAQGPHGP